jgi:hypothetical protein
VFIHYLFVLGQLGTLLVKQTTLPILPIVIILSEVCSETQIYFANSEDVPFKCIDAIISVLFQFKEALSCYFAVTACLVLTVIVSVHSQSVTQTSQTTSEQPHACICNDFNVIVVGDDRQ